MTNNNPSIDPTDNGTLVGSLQFAFKKLLQQVNGMLPARVIDYDRTTNRVQVQLLIAIVTTDGSQVPRPQIASLPVLILGGGGFMLSFPINTGDLGWVLANDRDISLFLESYTESPPNTARIKNFSDGLFIPDVMRGYTINTEDAASLVISTIDGNTRIALSENSVKITSPSVIIDSSLTVTGIVNAQGGITGSGGSAPNPFILTGSLLVDGNIGATGTITPGV